MANFQTILTTQSCLNWCPYIYTNRLSTTDVWKKKNLPFESPDQRKTGATWNIQLLAIVCSITLPETNLLPLKSGGKAGRRMFFPCGVEEPISRGEVLVVGEGSIILMTFYDESWWIADPSDKLLHFFACILDCYTDTSWNNMYIISNIYKSYLSSPPINFHLCLKPSLYLSHICCTLLKLQASDLLTHHTWRGTTASWNTPQSTWLFWIWAAGSNSPARIWNWWEVWGNCSNSRCDLSDSFPEASMYGTFTYINQM